MRVVRIQYIVTLLALLMALPVLGVFASWVGAGQSSMEVLSHLFQTVMGEQTRNSALLALGVALGTLLVGGLTAAAIALLDFPGRKVLSWALLLPLAMPAYVLAYVTTDTLQFSGPLQTWWRQWQGQDAARLPDVRSLWGAVVLFVLCLYPYVYLLTRAALAEQGVRLLEAARLLGAGWRRQWLEVALPVARPALMAGVALALMETLADYGVGSYFGLNTFTTGIYRAWLSMDDRQAAAQLASLLLLVVAALMGLELRARRGMRVSSARASGVQADATLPRLSGWRGLSVAALCSLPVWLGFVLPVGRLLQLMWAEHLTGEFGLPWRDFLNWAMHSLILATGSAALAVALALGLTHAARWHPGWHTRLATQAIGLGYAVPGAVLAVGLLLPVGALQAWWPTEYLGPAWRAWSPSAIVTGTVVGLIYAYLARFSSVALQSVQAGYAQISPSLDESARLLGRSPGAIWWQVHRPMLQRPALVAALLVFVDVMKELPATLVLRPFNTDTLAVVAYQLARDERLGEAALPSLAIVLVGLIPVIGLSRKVNQKR
jgi:iron(III) transport system permease protein